MAETNKEIKKSKAVKYKAVDPKAFKATFNEAMLSYKDFSDGKAVECDKNHKQFQYLLNNKFITQE